MTQPEVLLALAFPSIFLSTTTLQDKIVDPALNDYGLIATDAGFNFYGPMPFSMQPINVA